MSYQIFYLTSRLKNDTINKSYRFVMEEKRENTMISYNKLWHMILDKKWKKTELCDRAGISSSTLAKLGKNEIVSIEVLERICDVLNCDIGDIMSFREGE